MTEPEQQPAALVENMLLLRREDFANDKVDAGDIGAGHEVTALYEITPVGSGAERLPALRYGGKQVAAGASTNEIAHVRLRYKLPGQDSSRLIETPIEWLLFSDFSVVLAFVHLYTMFMIVPIFNSMMRIDRSLIEAASDSGASGWQTLWNVIVPLSRTGIIIGSIFVITIVMGDFVTIGVMGGQQIASIGKIIQVQTSYLQFPLAAANAVILLAVVLMAAWAPVEVTVGPPLLMLSWNWSVTTARPLMVLASSYDLFVAGRFCIRANH